MKVMTLTPTDECGVRPREEHAIQEWRAHQLQRLGLSRLLAYTFASRVDWHDVADLVGRGCAPELALTIVY
jgi:hypothetical protein